MFIRVPFVFIRVPLVFIRVHSCSFVFHSCSLVFTRVHSCSTRVVLVFIRVHSCSLVFIRVHSCSDLCSLSSYLCYPLYLFPSTNIFCLYPPHPISRYFCKESLMTPPPQHTGPLQVSLLLLLPLQKFSSYYFLHFPFCSFVFHSCSLVFIRVPFVFIRVHSCSTRVHSCSTRVHSCSFVFTRVPICVVF